MSVNDFIISRQSKHDAYQVWRFDPDSAALLTAIPSLSPTAKFDPTHQLACIGDYLIEWGPLSIESYYPCYPYRLFKFDPTNPDPLAGEAVQKGLWPKAKFWGSRVDFGNPTGGNQQFNESTNLKLIPLDHFMLNLIPTQGRGTFQLWNFDPSPTTPNRADPLPAPYTPQGAFETIQLDHELIPIGGYVLDRLPQTGEYWLWSFDAQSKMPLARPEIQSGRWDSINAGHQLVAIGNLILDWVPADRSYRLWNFDPKSKDPLCGPVKTGMLPDGFTADTTLLGVQTSVPVSEQFTDVPGTMDFMRSKIKHVVYYMLENRSFDHVCGWLHEQGETGVHFIGSDAPFNGASTAYFNYDGDKKVPLSLWHDGKLSTEWTLDDITQDPYHDNSDVMRQLFEKDLSGYMNRAEPNMRGFIWNNGTDQIMKTYTPEQLPVLNGLAQHFAVSDAWFCSMPGGTDVNRAFSLTGSSLNMLNNFQNGAEYQYWPQAPHRPSIFKVLWSNGITDWKIYNSVEWMNFTFTAHLFLDGQIPSVDQNKSDHLASIDTFKQQAKSGTLPSFSYLEPIWIAMAGTSSYHPGGDLVPGEVALNEIYNALKDGPNWEETLLVITFDEHGGIYDHVPPPYAENPYPNDVQDGFRFDLMGVRVPTLLVSPWIKKNTVFRSETPVAYDSTSFLATLLHWYGIPKARWGMGERVKAAPTFEGVLLEPAARKDAPELTPPYDKNFPPKGKPNPGFPLHDLHRLMVPRLVWSLLGDRLGGVEAQKLSQEILAKANCLEDVHSMIKDAQKVHGVS